LFYDIWTKNIYIQLGDSLLKAMHFWYHENIRLDCEIVRHRFYYVSSCRHSY
jgi:hypothetical protein